MRGSHACVGGGGRKDGCSESSRECVGSGGGIIFSREIEGELEVAEVGGVAQLEETPEPKPPSSDPYM